MQCPPALPPAPTSVTPEILGITYDTLRTKILPVVRYENILRHSKVTKQTVVEIACLSSGHSRPVEAALQCHNIWINFYQYDVC